MAQQLETESLVLSIASKGTAYSELFCDSEDLVDRYQCDAFTPNEKDLSCTIDPVPLELDLARVLSSVPLRIDSSSRLEQRWLTER